jgi:Glutamate-1-semialdehyde aminotransferase
MGKYIDGFDYNSIHAKAREVIFNPKRLKPDAIARYMNYFETRCARSKAMYEEAKTLIVNGIQHNLANNYPFPLTIKKAEGAYLYDVDGNRYIDFLQAGGPTILGNNDKVIKEKVIEMIQNEGPLSGLYSKHELELAKLINKYYPSCEMFRMLGSGTEADIIAIRLARAFTGKKNIIRIINNYHGWSDQLIYNSDMFADENDMLNGIPAECGKYTSAIPVNDIEALEKRIIENMEKGGTAAFIMEGIGQDSGALPTTREFHKQARTICDKYGLLMIYDEVVTAFRLGMGGSQALFGIKPDITVFGKIIGGQYPAAGGIGGRREIMDQLAAGLAKDRAKKVRVGGTLSANPLTCVAGSTAINELEKRNAHEKLKLAADEFTKKLVDLADKYNIPALIFNQHSILHIDVCGLQHIPYFFSSSNDPECKQKTSNAADSALEFAMALAAEGVIVAGGNKTYMSLQSIDVLDDALKAYERVFSQFE